VKISLFFSKLCNSTKATNQPLHTFWDTPALTQASMASSTIMDCYSQASRAKKGEMFVVEE
jgi:hypothetical protein